MKILIITVAGMSSRFSASLGYESLKCIYYKNSFEESLLYQMVHKSNEFDRYIIVGGYKYDELKEAVSEHFCDLSDQIDLVYNEHFQDYGSGYSLYMGLCKAMEYDFDQIVFAEGDLFVDGKGFAAVVASEKNVITSNQEAILANKAVAYYYDESYQIHYIYDTGHKALEIKEPFTGIFNSGQIWKFARKTKIRECYKAISNQDWQGTNLVYVQKYFGSCKPDEYERIIFHEWINCNTIDDFNTIEREDE